MVRFFFILIGLALAVWVGQRYFMDHPSGSGFWDYFGSHMDSSPAQNTTTTSGSASPTPADHSIKGCRVTLQALMLKTFVPIEESKDFSAADATRTLQQTQRDLAEYRLDIDYKNMMQACAVFGQALQDRQNCLLRYQRAAATPVPAAQQPSTLKTSSLQLSTSGTQTSNSFFKDAALKDWRARCDYYQPLLERLLTPSS